MATIFKASGSKLEVTPANGTNFDLRELQDIVGGYIELIRIDEGRIMVVNEDGRNMELPPNRRASEIYGYGTIVGDVLVGSPLEIDGPDNEEEEEEPLEDLRLVRFGVFRLDDLGDVTVRCGSIHRDDLCAIEFVSLHISEKEAKARAEEEAEDCREVCDFIVVRLDIDYSGDDLTLRDELYDNSVTWEKFADLLSNIAHADTFYTEGQLLEVYNAWGPEADADHVWLRRADDFKGVELVKTSDLAERMGLGTADAINLFDHLKLMLTEKDIEDADHDKEAAKINVGGQAFADLVDSRDWKTLGEWADNFQFLERKFGPPNE